MNIVVVEISFFFSDDLDLAPDFFEYFLGTYPILKRDPTLWCVSAWNDNGKVGLVDENAPDLVYRTDFFPGLGWMLTKSIWAELAPKWPSSWVLSPVLNNSSGNQSLNLMWQAIKLLLSHNYLVTYYLAFMFLLHQCLLFHLSEMWILINADACQIGCHACLEHPLWGGWGKRRCCPTTVVEIGEEHTTNKMLHVCRDVCYEAGCLPVVL